MSGSPIGIVDTDVGPLVAPIDPWIWPCLIESGRWEPMVGDAVRSVLRQGDIVVNVGAHVGYFTRLAALALNNTGWVYAYEPAPSNRRLLRLNTDDLANVVIRDAAVSDNSGYAMLTFSGVNPGDHRLADAHPDAAGSITVRVATLDEEAFDGRTATVAHDRCGVRLIFTDAQGLDLHILRGARRLIDRERPHIMIEWTPHMLDRANYGEVDRILDLGYTATLVEGPHIVINRATDGDIIGQGTGTLWLAPRS